MCLHDASKRLPRRLQEGPKTDFASVLGANLGLSWAPFSAQDGPGGLQDAPSCPTAMGYAPYFFSFQHEDNFKRILGGFWSRLGLILGGFLGSFSEPRAAKTPPDANFSGFFLMLLQDASKAPFQQDLRIQAVSKQDLSRI